ncbi:MAG: TetR/AcrR family transcriptional regulator [Candidatus Nanopelagicales bacterium]
MAAARGNTQHDPTQGRKAAYFARNRIALLKAAQAVLAEHGPDATIDQFADAAQISISTIYKHFENKDALVEAALITAMTAWEEWMAGVMAEVTDPLEQLVTPIRLFLRMRTTHPRYAQLVARNLVAVSTHTPALTMGIQAHVKQLLKAGVLKIDNPELRLRNLSAVIFSAMQAQLVDAKSKDAAADLSVEIGLGMLGLTPAKAHKLMTAPLPKLEPAPASF